MTGQNDLRPEEVFPLDLWDHIASFVDMTTLVSLSSACHQLQKRYQERIRQYRLKNWGYRDSDVLPLLDDDREWIITEPGTYTLREDITCSRMRLGGVGPITIDGKGHTVYFSLKYGSDPNSLDRIGFLPLTSCHFNIINVVFECMYAPDERYRVAFFPPYCKLGEVSGFYVRRYGMRPRPPD